MKNRLIIISTLSILILMMMVYILNGYGLNIADKLSKISILAIIFISSLYFKIPKIIEISCLFYLFKPVNALIIYIIMTIISLYFKYQFIDDYDNQDINQIIKLLFIPSSPKDLFVYQLCNLGISKFTVMSLVIISQIPLIITGYYLNYLFKMEEYITMVTVIVGLILISYIGLNYYQSIKGD